MHLVHGANIEVLTWGTAGKPGLLLLHGKMAHADWWSFIAPFFAKTHRVVALSWSGMGGSDWREKYTVEIMAEEAHAVAEATGLYAGSTAPVVLAHSFGAFVALAYSAVYGDRLGGLITLDMPLLSREQRLAKLSPEQRAAQERGEVLPETAVVTRPNKVYATLPEALARFRFAPPQICENFFIADHIAHGSLKQANDPDMQMQGFTWRFDPKVWHDLRPGRAVRSLSDAKCPIAVMWGSESVLVNPEVVTYVASVAPPDTPFIEIPAARHHVMVDEPLALIAALRALLSAWPKAI